MIALAVLVIASASVAYLRSTVTSKPTTPAAAPTIDPLLVTNNPVSYDFITPSIGWASSIVVGPASETGQVLVFKTVDGAKHWEQQLAGPTSFPGFVPLSVQFFGKTRGFLAVGMPVELYRTTDGGAHWAAVSLPPSSRIDNIAFSDASYGWLVASPPSPSTQALRLYATRDGGNNWERLADPPVDAGDLSFRHPTDAWMGGFGPGPPHVYSSSDGGQSWQRHDLPAPAGGAWTPDSYFPNFPTRIQLLPKVGAIVSVEAIRCVATSTLPGSTTCLSATGESFDFTSDDGGKTWRPVPPAPGSVAYQDSVHWWATSERALFKSADAGQSWRQVATIPAGWQFSVPGILDSKHAWASLFLVGGYGLALTNDGGLHWTLAKVPRPN